MSIKIDDIELVVGDKYKCICDFPQCDMIVKKNDIFETIRDSSQDASMVFLGIRPPGIDEEIKDYVKYYEGLLENTKDLPLLIKTLASEDIEFQRIFKC